MDHPVNPWSSVPSERPYVLECDRDSVAEYNAKYDKCRAEKYRLRTDMLPEPFIGRVEAPVVLLNLNPGFRVNFGAVAHERVSGCLLATASQIALCEVRCLLLACAPSLEGGTRWLHLNALDQARL